MTTLEKAARQALDALEEYQNNGAPFMSCDAAVETLRQALEQPTSGDYARGYAEGFNDACKPAPTVKDCLKVEPKQEQDPYGWKVQGVALVFTGEYAEEEAKATAKRIDITCEAFPLYTEPPKSNWQEIDCPCCGDLARAFPPAPKREWVELTEVERQQALDAHPTALGVAYAIEAKLKEKNANV